MIVSDEKGGKWEVTRGDPGWPHVNRLYRMGFREIALPQVTIIGGEVVKRNDTTLQALYALGDSVPSAFLLEARLYDCCAALENVV